MMRPGRSPSRFPNGFSLGTVPGLSAADVELLIALIKERQVIGKGDDGGELEAAVLVAALVKRLGGADALGRLLDALEGLAEAYTRPAIEPYEPNDPFKKWVGGAQIPVSWPPTVPGTTAPSVSPGTYIPPTQIIGGTNVPMGGVTWTVTCDGGESPVGESWMKKVRI